MIGIKDSLLKAKESQKKALEKLRELKAKSNGKPTLQLDAAIRETEKGLKKFSEI
ncbi:MAG: hypothetical protein NTX25_23270 [Proteobacteria bacterium]|nr:hypothetical protein [Pseudomonadota bacterium]